MFGPAKIVEELGDTDGHVASKREVKTVTIAIDPPEAPSPH